MPGIYIRLGVQARRLVGGFVTPNDIPGGVAGWWELHPDVGAWTRSDAGIDGMALWTPAGGVWTAGEVDPLGGNAAYLLTENVGAILEAHRIHAAKTNTANSWQDYDVWIESVDRDWVRILFGTSANNDLWINNTTGVLGVVSADLTATLVESVGTWRHWHITSHVVPTTSGIYHNSATGDGNASYIGDGRADFRYYGAVPRQERLSAIADLSRIGGTGAYRGANLVNATTTTQPLFQDTFATINGRPVALRESGRSSYLSSTHADVLAVASGDDPAFCLFGVTSFSGIGGGITSWQAGAGFDLPLRSTDGINVHCRRSDGVNPESVFAWPGVTIADFAAPVACAVICNTDRTRELWIAGVYRSTVTLADLAAWNSTTFYTGYSAGTSANNQLAAVSVRAGQLPGATAADRYQVIRPALQGMASRWGLTA